MCIQKQFLKSSFFLMCLVAKLTFADGCFVSDNYGSDVYAPDQKVVISWNGTTQTMLLSTKIQSDELANFGWIIPIQATNKPEVELGDAKLFDHLSDYFKSIKEEIRKSQFLGIEHVNLDSIEVLESKKLDIFDITILRASDADQLYKWLQVSGFKVNEKSKDVMRLYTKKDFFFIVVKINLLNSFQLEIERLEQQKVLDLVKLASEMAPARLRTLDGVVGLCEVFWDSDDRCIALASDSKTIKTINVNGGDVLQTLKCDKDYITSVCLSPDGNHIAFASGCD